MPLKGSNTEKNLLTALSDESRAHQRYVYFASIAEAEGYTDIAAMFRATAESETTHTNGIFEYLKEIGDEMTGLPFGVTEENLKIAIQHELHESTQKYPKMAETARAEGFDEIANWFETLAKAEGIHAKRFKKIRDQIDN